MLCIVCELVIAVCTLAHLFNLQHSVVRGQEWSPEHICREKALGFLSLSFTLVTLVVLAIGTEKLVRSGWTVWARVSGNPGAILPHGGVTKTHGDVSTSVVGLPLDAEDHVEPWQTA